MSTPSRQGVIHDLGYRGFQGRRLGTGAILRELFTVSLGHAFGVGRSGKSKVMPWLIAGLMLIPAVVLAGIIVQLGRMSLTDQAELFAPLSNYFGFPYWTQLLITVFVATQAPVLFARDLRYRTIVLYFARPVSRTMFVLTRLAALATAIFLVVAVPMTIWYGVAMTSELDRGVHTRNYLSALFGALLLALILAAIAGLVCTLTTRSGLAVAAVIIVLMVTSGIVTSALSITYQSEHPARGQIPASFNPFTAVAELVAGLFDQPTPNPTIPRPTGVGVPAAAAVCVVWVVAPTLLLIQRMRKAASL
ncbi:ABC-2 type transport system permease protein [Yimella lutea]|uniref:ABC-2 type transport system permease protein n=1 Tax=Yimella lutea TaxID=587872 RepID=A0A542EE86_9MICO|nr:ABC transporter permease subunit [Yimella lutea]TQJ13635.1 ABC-2 type transport system permease protein [Yimella lutea]